MTSSSRPPDAGISSLGLRQLLVTVDDVNPEAPWPEVESASGRRRSLGVAALARGCRSIRNTSPTGSSGPTRRSSLRRCAGRGDPRTGSDARIAGLLQRWPETAVSLRGWPPTSSPLRANEGKLYAWAAGISEPRKCRRPLRRRWPRAAPRTSSTRLPLLPSCRRERLGLQEVLRAADALLVRQASGADAELRGEPRTLNWTNACYFLLRLLRISSKGKLAEDLRGWPYLVPMDEIVRRSRAKPGSAVESRGF